MKTIIMTIVLLLSTYTFADEARGVGFMADRIEIRQNMKNENQLTDKVDLENHCNFNDFKNKTVGC